MAPRDDGRFCVVFDCESDGGLVNVPPADRIEHISRFMQFTVACALVVPSRAVAEQWNADAVIAASRAFTWWRDVAPPRKTPIEELLTLFDEAEVIVGYNCLQFDFPLLRRFYKVSNHGELKWQQRYANHRCKCLDLMLRLRDATGCYFKLDDVLLKNALPVKSSSGAEAVRMWEQGRREELERYCATDVEVTARLALAETLLTHDNLLLSHQVFGLRCALAARHAACKKRAREDEEFVLV